MFPICLQTPYATQTQPRRDAVRCLQLVAANRDHRVQGVLGLLKMKLLLEIERIREKGWRNQMDLARPMRLTSRADDATQVRGFGPFARQLGAIALRGRPLIAEHIRSWWLPIGSEQVDKAESQKGSLPQTNIWGGSRLFGHALQEDGVGQSPAAIADFSAHALSYLHRACRTARPSRTAT